MSEMQEQAQAQAQATSHEERSSEILQQSLVDESGGVYVKPFIFTTVLLAVFITFSAIFTYYFFVSYVDQVSRAEISSSYVHELRTQRANEAFELSTYGIIDAENSVIRLPIEEGMRKAVRRYQR